MNVNKDALSEINEKVSLLIDLCKKDRDLQPFASRFEFEQAADKAAFELCKKDPLRHMERILKQMCDLARDTASFVLKRSAENLKQKNEHHEGVSSSKEILRVNSVDEFTVGGDTWLECSATVSFLCVSLMSLVILLNVQLRRGIQDYLLSQNVLDYINEALKISKEHELNYFLEGHKTELVRLLANISFENEETSVAICNNDDLLINILSNTGIDEENPGVGEWGKLAIRNLCFATPTAREKIKMLKPLSTGVS